MPKAYQSVSAYRCKFCGTEIEEQHGFCSFECRNDYECEKADYRRELNWDRDFHNTNA